MAGSFNIADMFAKLGLRTNAAEFAAGQAAIEGVKFGLAKLAEIAHVVAEQFEKATFAVFENADHLDDLAAKTGVSVKALQELGYAGQFADVGMDTIAQGLRILQRNMVGAVEGNKDLAAAFKLTGVSLTDGHGKIRATEETFTELADAFAAMPESAKKTQLMMALFGKSGAELTGIFNLGSEGIHAYAKELQALGGELGDETIKNSAKLEDNFIRLKTAGQGIRNTIAEALLPVFNELTTDTLEWVKANQDLIRTKVREYVLGAVDAVRNFVSAIREWLKEHGGLSHVIDEATTVLKTFLTYLGVSALVSFAAAIDGVTFSMKGLRAAIAANPLGLLAIALTEMVLLWIDNWEYMSEFFALIWEGLKQMFSDLGDALAWLGKFLWGALVEPFIDAGKAIERAFGAAIDWVADKIDWVVRKFEAVKGILTKINPFDINDTSSSGVRGVGPDTPSVDVIRRLGGGAIGDLPGPALVERGTGGGGGVSIVNSPQFNVTQLPGENSEALAQRIHALGQAEQERALREAQAAVIY